MHSLPRTTLALLLAGMLGACASGQPRTEADSGSKVTTEDAQLANESIEHMLERKAPGLVIVPNGDGVALQIRGNSQIDGSNTPPLYILNGLPFTPGPGGLVSGININDIDTVKVLKGTQTAIYGIDGANGVIVITTKMGGTRSR